MFTAEQERWARLVESRIKANATTVDGFWDYDFDEPPFAALGGYDQAVRVFGGTDAFDTLLGGLNNAIFDEQPDNSHPRRARTSNALSRKNRQAMPLTPDLRRSIDQIRDYLYGGGYPNPAQNAEQLTFLFFFYMFEAIDAANLRAPRRPGAEPAHQRLRRRLDAAQPAQRAGSRHGNRPEGPASLVDWANALNGERLVPWVRDEVFPFYAEIAATGVTNFMEGARLVIDEPTVLSQVLSKVNDLHLETMDADTKGDLFEHVLRQIKQAGELGQFRTPRHVIRAIVDMVDPNIGETVYDPAAGTAGFLVAAYDHIRLANSSDSGVQEGLVDGKTIKRGLGDMLSRDAFRHLQKATFYGNDVDPQMVRLATMNLFLRGLDKVRILRRDALTRTLDRAQKAEFGLPAEGFDVVLDNPPFSGRRAMPDFGLRGLIKRRCFWRLRCWRGRR